MATVLSSEIEEMIAHLMATGRYRSAEDVIKKALSVLDHEVAVAGVKEGYADYLAGRVVSLEESNANFHKKYGAAPGEP